MLRNDVDGLRSDLVLLRNEETIVGATPTFDVRVLMSRARLSTARELAERCGVNRKAIHNRVRRGISWAEADEYAIRCGFFPWEVWPDWAEADPASWTPPICGTHPSSELIELNDLTLICGACATSAQRAA